MTTLEQLSAAATQAMEKAMKLIDEGAPQPAISKASFENTIAHEKLAHALVNAYRTGQLVEVQADDATVDRVARAICKARYLNGGDTSDDGWVECQPRLQDDYREQATAAIAAMKGPKL